MAQILHFNTYGINLDLITDWSFNGAELTVYFDYVVDDPAAAGGPGVQGQQTFKGEEAQALHAWLTTHGIDVMGWYADHKSTPG